jgi:very-short-patch-repair endonuclease
LLRAAESGARSEAERLVVRLLTVSGLRGWVLNHPFGGYVLDIAFRLQRLAIEIDGWAFHSDSAAFQRDRIRQNVLSASWTVLRYTWRDLTERPGDVIAEIRALVDRVQ